MILLLFSQKRFFARFRPLAEIDKNAPTIDEDVRVNTIESTDEPMEPKQVLQLRKTSISEISESSEL